MAAMPIDGCLQRLSRALENDELNVFYQPQVDSDGALQGLEALVRWHHPEDGLLAPDQFLPCAEGSDVISEIGGWVLRTACAQLGAWQSAGYRPLRLGVNLASRHFGQPDLVSQVEQALAAGGLSAGWLDLELPETLTRRAIEDIFGNLHDLSALGVGLSIDDFGTGQLSLSDIRRIPLDNLKVDRSLVCNVAGDPNSAALVGATIAMAHGAGLNVVAEGVENADQRAILLGNDCDGMQGYLFGRPAPAYEIEDLLSGEKYLAGEPDRSLVQATGV